MKQPALANAELAVMDLLWQNDRMTARQIREQLYPDATKAQHGTVQRLLQRFRPWFGGLVGKCELSFQLLCPSKWMRSSGNGFWHTNWRMCGVEITWSGGSSGWHASASGGILWSGGPGATCGGRKRSAVMPWSCPA